MIHLEPVTVDNFAAVIGLEVCEEQKNLVLSNAISLAQAYVQPECVPTAIYDGDMLVGFLMYCIDRDDGEYWMYRLMIDQKFQRRGFARAATQRMIETIKKDTSRHQIFLGVDRENTPAAELYLSLGFRFNGQVFGKERIMVLAY
ncbi:MAG: GNAT family N-acetyltransferase [Oscillospiraceae bacterium]|nr:GNAT family N-acetyltransferase [Oscillospiraceae bacterium]